ncbi:hypothetical protein ABIF65_011516 [Bradyrhizobium japonicum]|uniref:hypothetical protein n=1 Tax=Bradyrhizobium TaxID=374 RepID=UPI001BA95F06|nr:MULTISPECIES: hypothetical protein [Bradyrhizobium]MBR1070811.1 hypothetical protein [Bradyrhizobium liaoningense]MDI2077443.1 hypothetical protein [Bradyrhizobium sp. Mp27]
MTEHESTADLVSSAALEMSTDYQADYNECRRLVQEFLQVDDEGLYHLELEDEGTATLKTIRNVVRGATKVQLVDVAQALTVVGGAAAAFPGEKLKFCISMASAGLYFIRAFRSAYAVKLDQADAALVWALHQLGGTAKRQALRQEWNAVVAASNEVEAETTEAKLAARLTELEKLGCVALKDDEVRLAQTVERK